MLVRFAALAVAVTGFTCGGDPVPPENKAPVAVGTMPDTTLVEGDVLTGSVAQYFRDPDGDALTYVAVSSNATVVTASMSGVTITVRAVAEGTATVTVTASDPDGESATQTPRFTVEKANQAPVVEEEIEDRTLTEGDNRDRSRGTVGHADRRPDRGEGQLGAPGGRFDPGSDPHRGRHNRARCLGQLQRPRRRHPRSEWQVKKGTGAASTGTIKRSVIRGTAASCWNCVTSSTMLIT